jgi:hypothetical protein
MSNAALRGLFFLKDEMWHVPAFALSHAASKSNSDIVYVCVPITCGDKVWVRYVY